MKGHNNEQYFNDLRNLNPAIRNNFEINLCEISPNFHGSNYPCFITYYFNVGLRIPVW